MLVEERSAAFANMIVLGRNCLGAKGGEWGDQHFPWPSVEKWELDVGKPFAKTSGGNRRTSICFQKSSIKDILTVERHSDTHFRAKTTASTHG